MAGSRHNVPMSKNRHPTPRQRVKAFTATVPPRNALVVLARARKAGAHEKTEKAERRASKVALKKLARDEG